MIASKASQIEDMSGRIALDINTTIACNSSDQCDRTGQKM